LTLGDTGSQPLLDSTPVSGCGSWFTPEDNTGGNDQGAGLTTLSSNGKDDSEMCQDIRVPKESSKEAGRLNNSQSSPCSNSCDNSQLREICVTAGATTNTGNFETPSLTRPGFSKSAVTESPSLTNSNFSNADYQSWAPPHSQFPMEMDTNHINVNEWANYNPLLDSSMGTLVGAEWRPDKADIFRLIQDMIMNNWT
jgi:hypothetical protein